MKALLLATQNAKKGRELAELARGRFLVRTLADVGLADVAIDENGATFAENARLKARAVKAALPPGLARETAWVLAVIAVLDYVYQRWSFEKSLRMTKEEIKEEMKELEGDPIVKARIKSIQREMARKRMMQEVPKSDVVVTNPTHIAVALKYDREKAGAPVVVAKGAGHIAEKIKEIARKHGVPVVENKPIARNLFRYAEIGAEIPVALYKAVAEILAYVYRLKGKYGK